MLPTTLAFVVITAVAVWWHVRASAPRTDAPAPARACPRCRIAVPAGAAACPACGAPQQLYELYYAPLAAAAAESAAGEPRALVRADMCVGCGTCVAACPEPGAITLLGKLAVVDDARCKGHGECVRGCPVGAILVTRGAAVNRVTVPLLDAHFQTTVSGIYIAGELGGRGLIRNAVNEGKAAVEHVARSLRGAPPARDDALDVIIVGSGPAGLSAGLEALRAGLRYVVLEQGSLSDTVRKYPRHKLLLAEPVRVPLYGDLWVADGSKESLLQVWETIVADTGLDVRTGEKVQQVVRLDDGFRVETANGAYRARRVVLAMGRRGSPRRLGVPGEGKDHVFYDIVEMEAFAGKRMVVVGGGDSAVESALGLANQQGTTVALSHRGDGFPRIAARNREKLERAIADGRVTPYLESDVREIRDDVVVLAQGGSTVIVPADYVVIRIGGEAPYAFLERVGVRIVEKDVPIPQHQARAG
ncbi:MAG TPA: NAD(P)-binding domain-containing protein [Gemmatimonadaceae bacterium]|nr:NAD(P)-binding domain-containing protein [Gemmatimonadaceae bacterium]